MTYVFPHEGSKCVVSLQRRAACGLYGDVLNRFGGDHIAAFLAWANGVVYDVSGLSREHTDRTEHAVMWRPAVYLDGMTCVMCFCSGLSVSDCAIGAASVGSAAACRL